MIYVPYPRLKTWRVTFFILLMEINVLIPCKQYLYIVGIFFWCLAFLLLFEETKSYAVNQSNYHFVSAYSKMVSPMGKLVKPTRKSIIPIEKPANMARKVDSQWLKGQILTWFCSGKNYSGFTVTTTETHLAYMVKCLTQIHNSKKNTRHISLGAGFWPNSVVTKL